jgi:hypothetical protein
MASTRERRSAHDPGVVLRDLAVMLADGGECLAALGALRDQEDLFGGVASDSTAFRVIDSVDEQCLDRLREAVALARARAWKLGARPQRREGRKRGERTVIDIDATLTASCSQKEGAVRHLQGRRRSPPAAVVPGRDGQGADGHAAARQRRLNTACDHIAVLDLALEQLDQEALEGEILVRAYVVQALLGLIEDERAYGGVFNVGASAEISILDLAHLIIDMTGSETETDAYALS